MQCVTVDDSVELSVRPCNCVAVKIARIVRERGGWVSDTEAEDLGVRIYHDVTPEGKLCMTGIAAYCSDCDAMGGIDIQNGRIIGIELLIGQPTFAEECRTSAGETVMNCLQNPVQVAAVEAQPEP